MGITMQLLSMVFAPRIRWQTALFGIFAAMAANHLPAVFAATYLSNVVSLIHVTIAASLPFIRFSLCTRNPFRGKASSVDILAGKAEDSRIRLCNC